MVVWRRLDPCFLVVVKWLLWTKGEEDVGIILDGGGGEDKRRMLRDTIH